MEKARLDSELSTFIKILYIQMKMSGQMIEMSGCSKIDIEVARMFWKSFTLQPPIESKLYSPDIKQRRKTADAGGEFSLKDMSFFVLNYLRLVTSGRRSSRKLDFEPMRPPSYVYDYAKYQYTDEEEKRRGMKINLSFLFKS